MDTRRRVAKLDLLGHGVPVSRLGWAAPARPLAVAGRRRHWAPRGNLFFGFIQWAGIRSLDRRTEQFTSHQKKAPPPWGRTNCAFSHDLRTRRPAQGITPGMENLKIWMRHC